MYIGAPITTTSAARNSSSAASSAATARRSADGVATWELSGPRGKESVEVRGAISGDHHSFADPAVADERLVPLLPRYGAVGAVQSLVHPSRHLPHRVRLLRDYLTVEMPAAFEHLRGIGVELQMVSTRSAVHISGSDFMAVVPRLGNKPIETIEAALLPSAKNALDELVWWARATMAARAANG